MAFRVELRGTKESEAALRRAPLILRDKILKQALREASTLFQKQAQQNVRGLKSEGRDRMGKKSTVPLTRQIRRKLITRRQSVVGRTHTTGLSRMYAASVEFGHERWFFGSPPTEGQRVRPYPFWRPAQDQTRSPINTIMVRSLRNSLQKFAGR